MLPTAVQVVLPEATHTNARTGNESSLTTSRNTVTAKAAQMRQAQCSLECGVLLIVFFCVYICLWFVRLFVLVFVCVCVVFAGSLVLTPRT